MSTVQDYVRQIDEKLARMLEATVLPEAVVRWKPAPDQWSVIEILAHVEEAVAYWVDELFRVIANPGVSWGRTLQHEGRLAAVARAPGRSTEDVRQGLERVRHMAKQRLAEVRDEDLAIVAPHVNPKFGYKPMRFLVEHFLVEHLEVHLRQIDRNLQRYSTEAQAGAQVAQEHAKRVN